ncbi:MAG: aminotransferase class I/II-fold pyridoxal phosphate-dependent enzyme, partial [Gammaproteobacteria bacterium]|nr:aminotransferase class I/II-fold pyridoxal phosphate-dependent enzyme [Gammaproteobacteria bacterium]
ANIRQIVRNREFVLNELAKLRRITGEVHSDGALYAFPRLDTTLSDMQLVERLIREFRIATIPGSAFGMEDSCYLRVSYGALDESTLEEGMHRLVGGLNAIFTE